jgi:hypothetical protein
MAAGNAKKPHLEASSYSGQPNAAFGTAGG